MFVFNDCRTDSRVLREAGSLAAAGHEVTIIARPSDPASTVGEREERDGFAIVRVPIPAGYRLFRLWLRYPWRITNWAIPRARRGFRRMPGGIADVAIAGAAVLASVPLSVVRGPFYLLVRYRNRSAAVAAAAATAAASAESFSPSPPRPTVPRRVSPIEWLIRWRWVITAWARAAAAAAGPADVYHGHDLTGLAAAIAAADLHRPAEVVYDSHEIYLESGANADQPAWLRRLMARLERRWIARAAALVTVNESLAEELGRRYAPARTVVVHNCPPRTEAPPADGPDLVRAAAGIPADEPIALYHGAFSRHRGLEELAAAVAEPGLERVHAVFLGYGGLRPELDALAAGPVAPGRVHVLAAVPPEVLGAWVASADVGVMAIQPSTINHRLATPNKLFECLAAGVPVVASDFPEMRRIVCDDPRGPLGVVAAPDDVPELAGAILAIVGAPPAEREALRARCLRAAHERWNWESESARLVDLYAGLGAPP
jgi:glycosyltransferase involved in cell wall biosynthesis